MLNAILVWRYAEAPEEYKQYHQPGCDTDWLAFVPNSHREMHIPWMEEGSEFGTCSVHEYEIPDGVIRCGQHS